MRAAWDNASVTLASGEVGLGVGVGAGAAPNAVSVGVRSRGVMYTVPERDVAGRGFDGSFVASQIVDKSASDASARGFGFHGGLSEAIESLRLHHVPLSDIHSIGHAPQLFSEPFQRLAQ